ncbi:MAG: L-2-hydroxyglutarate oxidase [Thermoplasmatota archaeon]
MSRIEADLAVIGGGVAGLCTARAYLQAEPEAHVLLLERGDRLGPEQSTHNSGVLHDGFEYVPGSNKARYATKGTALATAFCAEHGVPTPLRGLLVVATDEEEVAGVRTYHERGQANGVGVHLVDEEAAREVEPHVGPLLEALHVPATRSIDSAGYVAALGKDVQARGATVRYRSPVKRIKETTSGATLTTTDGTDVHAERYLNAAGVNVDRLAAQVGADDGHRIVPFRGDYHELTPKADHLCRGHIYPAPRLDLPFLGVHLSRTAAGKVIVGPNAALAGGRFVYSPWGLNPKDLARTTAYKGFRRLMAKPQMRKHVPSEIHKSLSPRRFREEAQKLVPVLGRGDMVRSFSGIRAQLVSPDGDLVMDLMNTESERGVHILSGASPGLTGSLPFGMELAERLRAM